MFRLIHRCYFHHSKRLFSGFRNVGFIGLGQMGSHMASNLQNNNFNLQTFDVDAKTLVPFKNKALSLKDLSQGKDVIITMLPDGEIVEETYCGEDGIIQHASPSTLLIDCSTIEPKRAKQLQLLAKNSGFNMIDAPVSGGINGAKNASLSFMVGGCKSTFDKALPLFSAMGKKSFYCGESGSGQVAKACNNMLLGITMAGLCEAIILGKRLGLNPEVLITIINASSGRCWSSELYPPVPGILPDVPASHNYEGGFSNRLLLKDLKIAMQASGDAKMRLNVGERVMNQYQRLCNESNYAKRDFSSLYDLLDKE